MNLTHVAQLSMPRENVTTTDGKKHTRYGRTKLFCHIAGDEFLVMTKYAGYQRVRITDKVETVSQYYPGDNWKTGMVNQLAYEGFEGSPNLQTLGIAFIDGKFVRNVGLWYNVHPHDLPTVVIEDQGPLRTAYRKGTEQWSGAIPQKWQSAFGGARHYFGAHVVQGGGRSYGPSFYVGTLPEGAVSYNQHMDVTQVMHRPRTPEHVLPANVLPDGRWNNASKIMGGLFIGDEVVFPAMMAMGNYTYGKPANKENGVEADHTLQALALGLPKPNLLGQQHHGMYGQTDQGYQPSLLVVSAEDLAAAYQGDIEPEQVPYDVVSLDADLLSPNGKLLAATDGNRLIVLEVDADWSYNRYEPQPKVHLYALAGSVPVPWPPVEPDPDPEPDPPVDPDPPVEPPTGTPWNVSNTIGLIDNTQHLVTRGYWTRIGAHYESIASRSSVQIQTGDNVQKADPANLARLKLVMDKFPHLLHCVGNHDGKHVDASWWDWTNWIANTDRQPNHTRIIGNTLFIVASHHFAIGQVNWMRDTAAAHDGPWVLVTHGVFKPYKWERWEQQVRAITPAPTLVISSHSEDYTMNSGETQMIYQGTPYEYAFAAGDTAYIQRGATLLRSGEPEYFLEFNPNLGCVDVYNDSERTHTVMLTQPIDLTDTPVIEPPPVDPCEDVQAELADAYQTITQQSGELLRSRDQLARIQAITKE